MIRFRLQCDEDHEFDVWFRNGADYEQQAKRGLVACPECNSTKVEKALMAPNVATSERRAAARAEPRPVAASSAAPPAGPPPMPPVPMPPQVMAMLAKQKEMMAAMRRLRDEVRAKAENVGPRFAVEARKIHYEETPARGIYGQATQQEAKALAEEGIEVLPLPTIPEDHN